MECCPWYEHPEREGGQPSDDFSAGHALLFWYDFGIGRLKPGLISWLEPYEGCRQCVASDQAPNHSRFLHRPWQAEVGSWLGKSPQPT